MAKTINWAEVTDVFILNLIPDTVGDTLYNVPLTKAIKRYAPNARVHITVSPQNANLLTGCKTIDNLLIVPQLKDISKPANKLTKLLRYLSLMRTCIKQLRTIKPQVCIIGQPNFAPSQLIPWLARVPNRVGYAYKKATFAQTLTIKAPFRSPYETGDYYYHYLEGTLDLLRAAGIKVLDKDKIVTKKVNPDAQKWAKDWMARHKLTSRDKIIAFQAGAKWRSKTWPEDRFTAVGCELTKNPRTRIVLIGSEGERETIERIAKATEAIAVIGEDIERVAALLEKCTLAFGNDSGIMHLASAVGTTPIVLYGMSIPDYSGPKGTGGYIALYGDYRTAERPVLGPNDTEEGIKRMESITVEKALKTIKTALRKTRR